MMETFEDFKTKFSEPEQDIFQGTPKSSVKLIKNSRGINWEIKVVNGEEKELDKLMLAAVETHKKLVEEFK